MPTIVDSAWSWYLHVGFLFWAWQSTQIMKEIKQVSFIPSVRPLSQTDYNFSYSRVSGTNQLQRVSCYVYCPVLRRFACVLAFGRYMYEDIRDGLINCCRVCFAFTRKCSADLYLTRSQRCRTLLMVFLFW